MKRGDIAIGTKVFQRYDELGRLLRSIPEVVSKVYVANDGRVSDLRSELPVSNYTFDVEFIDLEYDAGLGAGRAAIVNTLTEPYLTIVDTDHRIPNSLTELRAILDEDRSLGGVGGALVEPENDAYFIQAQDFKEKNGALVRSATLFEKNIELVAGLPLIRFDFIPNAAMFRRECLMEYSWDPNYVIEREHTDFYVGHWKQTDWEFAVCPRVIFEHYPGGDSTYLSERNDSQKQANSEAYFLEKWGYESSRSINLRWCEGGRIPHGNPSHLELAGRKVTEGGVKNLINKSLSHFLKNR